MVGQRGRPRSIEYTARVVGGKFQERKLIQSAAEEGSAAGDETTAEVAAREEVVELPKARERKPRVSEARERKPREPKAGERKPRPRKSRAAKPAVVEVAPAEDVAVEVAPAEDVAVEVAPAENVVPESRAAKEVALIAADTVDSTDVEVSADDSRVQAAPARILVTGATGFIGRRLLDALEGVGPLRAFLLPGDELEGDVEIFRGDVRDRDAVVRACRDVDVVYHLAEQSGDWGKDEAYWTINVEGTRNVLTAAVAAGCRRVVFVSSIIVYGSQLHTSECAEDIERGEALSPYGRSKAAADALAREVQRRGDIEVVVVRPGNVFGPGSSPWVLDLARVLRKGQAPLIDGGQGDAALAYVDNVVDVLMAAGMAPEAAGRIYNVVDGQGVTWRRYLSDLAAIVGAKPPRLSVPHAVAWTAAKALERFARFRKSEERPLLTREAVALLSTRQPIPIERAVSELGYRPRPYEEALREVARSLEGE